jgi:hypothetical protein
MLIETIQKYPDDKHFVYSAFHEDGDMVGHGAEFESIDYGGDTMVLEDRRQENDPPLSFRVVTK